MLADRYRDKIEKLVERSGGRVRADIVHERLCALDPLPDVGRAVPVLGDCLHRWISCYYTA
jgi:hypothetical protein